MNSAATPEGRIDARLAWPSSSRTATVTLRSSRPLQACRLFEQQPIERVLTLLPRLFSVCGRAQSVAAVRAVETASAAPASAEVEAHRDVLLKIEGVREHLWRIFIDWPTLMAQPPRTAALAPLNHDLSALMAALDPERGLTARPGLQLPPADRRALHGHWQRLRSTIEQAVFGTDVQRWHKQELSDDPVAGMALWPWLQARGWLSLGDVPLRALPPLRNDALAPRFEQQDSADWIRQPDWQGRVFETGPLARHARHPRVTAARQRWGCGLATRLLARLVALAESLDRIDARLDAGTGTDRGAPDAQPSGQAVAQVETSRGRLIHWLHLEGGTVQGYRILAPTEWNFHPSGVAAQALATLPGDQDDELIQQQARCLLQAIDPCVGFTLSIDRQAGGVAAHA